MNLAELLKDSAYRLTQFKPAQIAALEASIALKDTAKAPTPYVTCLVRGKPVKLTPEEAVRQLFVIVLKDDLGYLNSIAGQYQVDQPFKGSSGQIELYPADITNFWCPELDLATQKKIDKLAQQSITLKAQSERLLEASKRAVEIAIEQDEAAGMACLANEGALT
jgi:hypothetical protein